MAALDSIQQRLEDMDFEATFAPSRDGDDRKLLDLVFIQDATGSQGAYISSATKNIEEISNAIFASGKLYYPDDLRIGLIAFRDHPPQDHTYVTQNFGFSSDIKKVHADLKTLYASGGGDGPEAITAALGEALNMEWRPKASKMIVLIADAPPHGIGEYGDGFDDGSPDGLDPLQIAREMAARGITLFFVACEPALSGYVNATDFYQALTGITSGLMLPLTTANLLAHAIIGSVLENLDMERLITEVGQAVASRILGGNESVDDVARELHERLLLRNENTQKVVVENIYRESEESKHNVKIWSEAPDIKSARPHLLRIRGSRFTEKYLNTRYYSGSRSSSSSIYPPIPPRSPTFKSTSPSRKVVTDFAAYRGQPVAHSMFGSAASAQPTFGSPKGRTSFGRMRGASMDEEVEEDTTTDDEPKEPVQRIGMAEGAITLEQARRITLQSAWRGTRM
ncbi:hypothetical protein DL93DRAFT_1026162 [Clavulina sp. PMI_390]|nr:hypothetical protein DL93DRAFT_1026162 [Clavulina sp. PMI_390]